MSDDDDILQTFFFRYFSASFYSYYGFVFVDTANSAPSFEEGIQESRFEFLCMSLAPPTHSSIKDVCVYRATTSCETHFDFIGSRIFYLFSFG